MSDNVVRLNIVVGTDPLPPFACVRGANELAIGPWPHERSPAAIVVARVERVVSVDEWEELFAAFLADGRDWPAYRAALEAVRRWGGRVLVEDPSTTEGERRRILTPEQEARHHAALEAAAERLAVEGKTPEALAAWEATERAYQAAQLAAIEAWPYAYASGEPPQVGDVIVPVGEAGPRMTVTALAPPELLVGGHLGELPARARALGAEIHPSLTRAIPQLCRLVRRGRSVAEA